jgi:hypothetical protein
MKVFNDCMVRVHLGRAKNAKKFDDLFMQRMNDKYEKKKTAANNKQGVEAVASHEDRGGFSSATSILNHTWSGIKKTITLMIATTMRMIATAMRLLA